MIKRNTSPFIGGIIGLLSWSFLSSVFYLFLSHEWLLSNVLSSKVNAVSFYLTGAAFGIVYERRADLLLDESAWRDFDLLPNGTRIIDYSDIAPYAERAMSCKDHRRSSCLIWTVFSSMRFQWNQSEVRATLDAAFQRFAEEIPTRYRMCSLISDVIMRVGFFGTLLGVAFAMPHLDDQVQLRAYISIAYNTSLVAFVLGAAVSWAFTLLREFDETILRKVYQHIEARLLWPMGEPNSPSESNNGRHGSKKTTPSTDNAKPHVTLKNSGTVNSLPQRSNGQEASK